MEVSEKYTQLQADLRSLGSAAIAFSGGVDSTLLLYTAHQTLGDSAVAVTAVSESFPERELQEAKQFCDAYGIRHLICESEELSTPGFQQNPKNRCYLCKRNLFQRIGDLARENGLAFVAEGSNLDDGKDYRPGMMALAELGIKSPLKDAQMTKSDIREISYSLGLPTWNKPSFACLASRIPYGDTITKEKLSMIDKAEQLLLDLGFHQVRVRAHGLLARIEILPEEFEKLIQKSMRTHIYQKFREFGFTYISMDLLGYRTGSMNETLPKERS